MGLLCVPIWVASLVSIFSSCRSLYQNFTAFWANAIPLHAYITYILYPSAFCVCTYAGTYTTVHVHFWRPESHKSPSFSLWVPGICTCIPRLAASAGWAEPFHQFYFPRCCFEPGSHLTNAGLRLMFSAGAERLHHSALLPAVEESTHVSTPSNTLMRHTSPGNGGVYL